MKVFLFGSHDVYGIPDVVVTQLEEIMKQTNGNVEFIVGDCDGVDSAFHTVLSRIGGRTKTKVYCMDYARNNKFEFEVKTFPSGDLVGREKYAVKDRQMVEDCHFAITVWDGKSKGTFDNVTLLKVRDKPVYIYTVA